MDSTAPPYASPNPAHQPQLANIQTYQDAQPQPQQQQQQQQQQFQEKGPIIQTHTTPLPIQPQDQSAQTAYQLRAYRTATPLNVLGRTGAPADCPACGQRNMTRVVNVVGNSNHLYAGVAFLFTGICCFVPYLMDAIKDVEHRCGCCGVLLATVHKSGRVDVHQFF